jgi:hypothetical protein
MSININALPQEVLDKLPPQLLEAYNDFNSGFTYDEKVKVITGKLNSMITEIALLDPDKDSESIQQLIRNIITLGNNLFQLQNDIRKNNDGISDKKEIIDDLIAIEKNLNSDLKQKMQLLKEESNVSAELVNDYTIMYDVQYMQNCALVLSIIVILFVNNYVYPATTT